MPIPCNGEWYVTVRRTTYPWVRMQNSNALVSVCFMGIYKKLGGEDVRRTRDFP